MLSLPSAQLPTRYGAFVLHIFPDARGLEHIALVKGIPVDGCPVRLHSECARSAELFSGAIGAVAR
jgi:GTP cyclohydrolase II